MSSRGDDPQAQSRDSERRTKIVATLGPATQTPEMIRGLVERGLDFVRVNASHGDHESHAQAISLVRAESTSSGRPVGVLFDLQGPKIRVRKFDRRTETGEVGHEVTTGEEFQLAVGREPTGAELAVDYDGLCRDVEVGDPLLIDDGAISSLVLDVAAGTIRCRALNDGTILPRKGINLPASSLSAPSLTEKDRADVAFAVEQGVDLIALSFVRRREDVEDLTELLRSMDSAIPIVAKIEKPQALDNLDGILEASWGVMVARGDLGVELPPEDVPIAQKRIIGAANRLGRPVITATQMLDSMTRNPRPTRAEASDVANAVLDGTDAVMLSGETATGRYPLESVEMMDRLVRAANETVKSLPLLRRRERGIDTRAEAVADAGAQVAHHLGVRAIVAFTSSGLTAILASRRRSEVPIIGFSAHQEVVNRLALVWGVEPHTLPDAATTDELMEQLDQTLIDRALANEGDRVIVLMGVPTGRSGTTNLMMVHDVGTWRSSGKRFRT